MISERNIEMAFIQTCIKCKKKIEGEFRMALMIGPKGYRRYAVHADCTNVVAGRDGGRQRKKRLAVPQVDDISGEQLAKSGE